MIYITYLLTKRVILITYFLNVFYCNGNIDNDIESLPYLLASFSVQLATVYEMSEKTFSEREKYINEHGIKEG